MYPVDVLGTEPCPCGRAAKPVALWLCRCCYLEKEIGYALSELERPGEAWHLAGLARLRKLVRPAVTIDEEAARG